MHQIKIARRNCYNRFRRLRRYDSFPLQPAALASFGDVVATGKCSRVVALQCVAGRYGGRCSAVVAGAGACKLLCGLLSASRNTTAAGCSGGVCSGGVCSSGGIKRFGVAACSRRLRCLPRGGSGAVNVVDSGGWFVAITTYHRCRFCPASIGRDRR